MEDINIDGFSVWLVKNNRRNTTIRKHISALRYLIKNVRNFTFNDIEAFLIFLKERNYSHSYINNFINCARLYGIYSENDSLLKLKQYPKKSRAKATFSDDEIEAFLGLPRRKNQPHRYYPKYKTFWHLVAFTGARPGEIAKLKKINIDWGRGVLTFEQTKTNIPGIVPIPPNCRELLKTYMDSIATDYLFPSGNGGSHYSMDGHAVIDNVDWQYDFVKRIAQMGGINRVNLTPYSFRHSMATRLLEENVSLFHVKKLMRHSRLETTEIYSHLTTKDITEAIQHHPLIRKGSDPRFILQSILSAIYNFGLDRDNRFKYQINQSERKIIFEVEIL